MTKTRKKQIQVSIQSEASEILAKLAKKWGVSLSSVTAKILEEKLLEQPKPQKKVNHKKNKRTAKFLSRLAQGKIQEIEGIEGSAVSDSPGEYYSTFKVVLSNTSDSDIDLRGLVVVFPVDDDLKKDLAVNSLSSTSNISGEFTSTVTIQGDNPSTAVTSINWSEESWVGTILNSGDTLEIIYGVSANATQAKLDAVIGDNIQVSTGTLEYTLTVLTPEQPEGVSASSCTFSVSGNGSPISITIPWNNSWENNQLSAGTYTVKPEDITEGTLVYPGIAKTVELTVNSPSSTVTIEYDEPVESIAITLSVDSEYADYSKTIKFVGFNGNPNHYEFSMEGAQKTVRVLPGEYNISASSLNIDGTLYVAQLDNPYNLSDDTSIPIEYEEVMAQSLVRGWPNYIAHGAVTGGSPSTTDYLKRNPVDAIFKYAGIDGAGDQGDIIPPKATEQTVIDSRAIEEATGKPVMPVMVVYTIEGSGSVEKMVADLSLPSDPVRYPGFEDYLWKHYVNLSTIAQTLQLAQDDGHPNPGCIVLNPDALGALQQNSNLPEAQTILTSTIAVNDSLATALQYLEENEGMTVDLGAFSPEDNFKGYVQSLHALIQKIAPDVTFGWQVNLWAGGSALWIHETLTPEEINENQSQPLVDFWNDQEVYNGELKPDFIVFDKYERDGFGSTARSAGYAFNANDWSNYIVYAKQISEAFGVPCMYWQIPGGHMPLVGEDTSIVDDDHSASAPDFFFGNPGIGTDISNISPELLELDLNPSIYKGATTVGEYLGQTPGYDWSNSQLEELANNNVFAILWGGGSTTSIAPIGTNGDDKGWLAGKVKDYYDNPQYLS